MPKHMNLTEVILDEISFVDNPANEGAKIALFKRGATASVASDVKFGKKENTLMPDKLTPEQERRTQTLVAKGYEQEVAERIAKSDIADVLEELLERAEGAEALCEKNMDSMTEMEEALKAADAKIEDGKLVVEKAAEPEYIDIDGERVLKSAIPAPMLKRMEKQEADLAELKKARELETLAKRASAEVPNLGGSDEAKGQLLKAIDALGKETAAELHRALKAADAAVSKMFEEVGKSGADEEGTATSDLRKMADAYATEHSVSFESAFAEVTKTKRGKELLAASRSEQ